MTPIFEKYAAWYDAFNCDKNYATEVSYILTRLKTSLALPRSWLDIGCGTGRHLAYLHSLGVEVEGLDRSSEMIACARKVHPEISFHIGSIEDFEMPGVYQVVSMLFHTVSYQNSDATLAAALDSVAAHLAPVGVFVFDFWNTEAVLRDPPANRIRRATVDGRALFRVATPVEERDKSLVKVDFEFRWDSAEGELIHEERHIMRHFTPGELGLFLNEAGLTVLTCEAWMRNRPLGPEDWYGFICARPKHLGS